MESRAIFTTSDWNLMESRVACCIRFSEYIELMSPTTLEIAMTEFIPNSIQTIFCSLIFKCFWPTYAKNLRMVTCIYCAS